MAKFNQIRIVTCLSCLIVPLLVTGPFLPDLLLSLLSIWFLHYIFRNKLYHLLKNNFFYFFLSFCFFCIFSSLMSDNIMLSFESSLFYFRIGVFCLLISYLIDNDKQTLNFFYYFLVITFVILILYAIFEYVFLPDLHPTRISSLFRDELILGSYLSRLFPLIVALFFVRKSKSILEKNLFLIFSSITYMTIFLSGERAALFYVNLFLIIIIIFVKIRLRTFLVVASSITLIFTVYMSSSGINSKSTHLLERYKNTIFSFIELSTKLSKKEQSTANNFNFFDRNKIVIFTLGHHSMYHTALNMFLDRPIIGHGPKMFRVKCSDENYKVNQYSCMTHPHNFYIQLLAETGIIGFSFLLMTFFYVMYLFIKYFYNKFFKKKKIYSYYNICLLAALLITTWPLIPNGNFFNNHLMIMYCLPLGFFQKNIKKLEF